MIGFQTPDDRLAGPSIDWYGLSPLLVLLAGALVLLVVASLTPRWPRGLYSIVTATTAGAALVLSIVLAVDEIPRTGRTALVANALSLDGISVFVIATLCASLILATLVNEDYLRRENMLAPEVHALALLGVIGAIVMAMANDLIVLFLGLEVMSMAFYVLTASHRRRSQSQEAGIKYFVLGAFSSAFFLYGIALLYGATASTNYDGIIASFTETVPLERKDALVLAGVALLIVGLAFKVSAVPFHFWTPDVYEGAPTPITAYMASVGKVAAFAALIRVLVYALPHWRDDWRPAIWVVAVVTLVVGSALAVVQTNVKRMLAYSSIAHAGYLLLGIIAANSTGKAAVLFYLLTYAVSNLGALGIVALLSTAENQHDELRDFAGLWRSRPGLAGLMTVFLLSLGGFPPLAGFIGKWYIFSAAVQEGHYWLAIIGVLTSVISVFFYLRIVVMMYMTEGAEAVRPPVPATAVAGLALATVAVFYLGVLPTKVLDLAMNSIGTIF